MLQMRKAGRYLHSTKKGHLSSKKRTDAERETLILSFHIQKCQRECTSGLGFEKHLAANHPQGMVLERERGRERERSVHF